MDLSWPIVIAFLAPALILPSITIYLRFKKGAELSPFFYGLLLVFWIISLSVPPLFILNVLDYHFEIPFVPVPIPEIVFDSFCWGTGLALIINVWAGWPLFFKRSKTKKAK